MIRNNPEKLAQKLLKCVEFLDDYHAFCGGNIPLIMLRLDQKILDKIISLSPEKRSKAFEQVGPHDISFMPLLFAIDQYVGGMNKGHKQESLVQKVLSGLSLDQRLEIATDLKKGSERDQETIFSQALCSANEGTLKMLTEGFTDKQKVDCLLANNKQALFESFDWNHGCTIPGLFDKDPERIFNAFTTKKEESFPIVEFFFDSASLDHIGVFLADTKMSKIVDFFLQGENFHYFDKKNMLNQELAYNISKAKKIKRANGDVFHTIIDGYFRVISKVFETQGGVLAIKEYGGRNHSYQHVDLMGKSALIGDLQNFEDALKKSAPLLFHVANGIKKSKARNNNR